MITLGANPTGETYVVMKLADPQRSMQLTKAEAKRLRDLLVVFLGAPTDQELNVIYSGQEREPSEAVG